MEQIFCSKDGEAFPPLEQDPLEHRLHCQISDCVQCRCDSGYMPFPPKYQRYRRDRPSNFSNSSNDCNCFCSDHDHDSLHHCKSTTAGRILRDEDTITSFPPSSSVAAPYHCHEHCQYCNVACVRRFECSKPSSQSDHVTVSSSHVCSCTCQPANLQPTRTPASSVNTTSAVTTSNASKTRRCSCPRWKFLVTTSLYRFMSRFSGRLRQPHRRQLLRSSSFYGWERMTSFLYFIITVATFCLSFLPTSDACSSRSTPKPRPPSPTLRPNITIQTYTCPPEYDAHYCLNGATCFTVKIGESILYNCECAEGYMGQRCEFKDLDGSYLPSKQRAMLEQAGLTSGAAIIVVIVVIVCFYLYVRSRRKFEISRTSRDVTDGMESYEFENERRPFSGYYYPSPLSLSHNHNHPDQQSFHSPTSNTPTSTPTSPTTYQQTTTHSRQQKHHQLPVSNKERLHGSQPSQEGALVPLTPTPISPAYPKHTHASPDSPTSP